MTKFRGIALLVSDMEKSANFYRNLFGFEITYSDTHKYELRTDNMLLTLYTTPYPVKPWTGGSGISLVFATIDLSSMEEMLRDNLVKIIKKDDSDTLLIIDPDGYVIALTQHTDPPLDKIFHDNFATE